jgi:2-iminobutanoate/2-iminopropanoate deaminase
VPREYFKGALAEDRGYSLAVKVTGGTRIYLAGLYVTETEAGESLAGNFDAQVRATFERMRGELARAGGTLDDLVTMTVFITDMRHGARFTELRRDYFTGGYPCSAMIRIAALARPEMMVEIQATAVVGD